MSSSTLETIAFAIIWLAASGMAFDVVSRAIAAGRAKRHLVTILTDLFRTQSLPSHSPRAPDGMDEALKPLRSVVGQDVDYLEAAMTKLDIRDRSAVRAALHQPSAEGRVRYVRMVMQRARQSHAA